MTFRHLVYALVLTSLPGWASGQGAARALIEGAWSGQGFVVKQALNSGQVDVDIKNPEGFTALMLSSLAGHANVVDILLTADADLAAANEDGETALILASKYGFTEIAAKLIDAGADPNAQDGSGRSAWTWANWGENRELRSLLEQAGADGSGKRDPFEEGKPVDRFETPPQMKKYEPPKMPDELKENGINGTIDLQLVVDRDGRPTSIELLEGIHDALDANALEAAESWRFEPAEIQNKPVVGLLTVSIDYRRVGGDPDGKVMLGWRRWRN